ncbi:MAG: hypothetical protein ACKO6N_25950 [Myxococcota bacterium]
MLGLVACSGDGVTTPTEAPTETPQVIADLPTSLSFSGEIWPEDVIVYDTRAFVSNFVYGGIQSLDLTEPTGPATQFVAEETGSTLTSWWGLKPDEKNN